MYIILVYDIGEKRVNKILKLCRSYLNWIQNSVFEGEISEGQYASMKAKISNIIKENDNVIIFNSRNKKWLEKDILGPEKSSTDVFL